MHPSKIFRMELAFPAPAAFAATIIPQATLHQQGIAFTSQYVSSHDSVYLSVAKGLCKAGRRCPATFKRHATGTSGSTGGVLDITRLYPRAIAVNQGFPLRCAKVSASLIALLDSAEGRSLLETIRGAQRFSCGGKRRLG